MQYKSDQLIIISKTLFGSDTACSYKELHISQVWFLGTSNLISCSNLRNLDLVSLQGPHTHPKKSWKIYMNDYPPIIAPTPPPATPAFGDNLIWVKSLSLIGLQARLYGEECSSPHRFTSGDGTQELERVIRLDTRALQGLKKARVLAPVAGFLPLPLHTNPLGHVWRGKGGLEN